MLLIVYNIKKKQKYLDQKYTLHKLVPPITKKLIKKHEKTFCIIGC